MTTTLPEVSEDGIQARFYVVGAMSPEFASEARIGSLIQVLLTSPMRCLPLEHRLGRATSALRGFVEHHEAPAPEVLCWHRQFGHTQVVVTRATTSEESRC